MTSELRVDRIIPINGVASVAQNLGGNAGGSVVQIRHSNTNNQAFADAETPSSAFVATGISGVITPTRSDSKILIIANPSVMVYQNNGNQCNGTVKIMRSIAGGGGYSECSPITIGTQIGFYDYGGNGGITYGNYSLNGVDEPNTTSEITYQFYVKRLGGTGIRMGYQLNADIGSNSFITMMEIAG